MLSFSAAYASFPVKRAAVAVENNVVNETSNEDVLTAVPAAKAGQQSKGIALILWAFLGGLAAHRWYLKSPVGWNILFILTLGGLGVWWVVDMVDIFLENYPNANFKSEFF